MAPRARARTRVLVLNERGIMRDGLCALLASSNEFEVVGSESTVTEALRSASSSHPDVVLADFPQAGTRGAEHLMSIKARLPHVRVVVLTLSGEEHVIDEAMRAGAHGYVLKSDGCNELFMAVRSVAAGKGFVSPSATIRQEGHEAGPPGRPKVPADAASTLTERELQVIRLIAAGHRTREIAQQLSLSHKTIEKHRSSLMRKLRLRNASAVAAYAIANGLGEP